MRVLLDLRKFQQIIINLIANALKFGSEGGHVRLTGEVRDNRLVVSVLDNGEGIPGEYKDLVFDKFFQVTGASDNKSAGTGLGLPRNQASIEEL